MNDLICERLNKIKQLQNTIKLKLMGYKAEMEKHYIFSKILLPFTIWRDIHTNILSIQNADNGQSDIFKELSYLNKCGKSVRKQCL